MYFIVRKGKKNELKKKSEEEHERPNQFPGRLAYGIFIDSVCYVTDIFSRAESLLAVQRKSARG